MDATVSVHDARSRSVWGTEGEVRSNQQNLISWPIKNGSKGSLISSVEYCLVLELSLNWERRAVFHCFLNNFLSRAGRKSLQTTQTL